METTYWLKQADKPLFEDVLWSRPENKRQAGKLLVIGGNLHGFSAPAAAYAAASRAGIGMARVILPDKLQKTVGKLFPEAQFAPSTPSGSFAQAALAELLDNAAWADGVLLAGDFGRNSETAILLEKFVEKYSGLLTLVDDSLDYFIEQPDVLSSRRQNVIVADFKQLQKLALPTVIKHNEDLVNFVSKMHEISQTKKSIFITSYSDQIVVAGGGQVSTTPAETVNLIELAAYASVWWLQQPQKPFEAVTTAIYYYLTY